MPETVGTGRENEGEAVSVSACSTVVCAVCTTDRSKDSKAEKTLGIAIDRTRKKIPSPIEERIRIVYENYGFSVQCDEHRTMTKCQNPLFSTPCALYLCRQYPPAKDWCQPLLFKRSTARLLQQYLGIQR